MSSILAKMSSGLAEERGCLLYVFELDNLLLHTDGSVFERTLPFTKTGPRTIADSQGVEICLDENALSLLVWLKGQGSYVSMSRYYKEPLVHEILEKLGILHLFSFIDVKWDRNKGAFVKMLTDEKTGQPFALEQSRILFIDTSSAYLTFVASYYKAKGMYKEALDYFQKVLKKNPALHQGYLNIGRFYEENLAEYDMALEYYLKAADLSPDDPVCVRKIADMFSRLGKDDEAIVYLTRLAEISSTPESWLHLGMANEAKGLHDEAVRCYRKVLEIEPENEHAQVNLSIAIIKSFPETGKDQKLFLQDVAGNLDKKVDKKAPDYRNLAVIYHALSNIEKEISCYNKYLSLAPDDSDTLNILGTLYEQKKDLATASRCYERALQADPRNMKAMSNLESVKKRLGDD